MKRSLLIDGTRYLLVTMHYHLIVCWMLYAQWTILNLQRQLNKLITPNRSICSSRASTCCRSTSGGIIVAADGDQADILSTMNDAISDVDAAILMCKNQLQSGQASVVNGSGDCCTCGRTDSFSMIDFCIKLFMLVKNLGLPFSWHKT